MNSYSNTSAIAPYEVLIVGGGPSGLAAAIALGRCGVKTLLVEKHPSTSFHPRGHVVNARTMEILRGWGLENAVRTRGVPFDRNQGIAFARSVAGEMIGSIRTYEDKTRNRLIESFGPSQKTSCPQDKLEPILRRAAESYPSVEVCFSTRLEGLEQDEEGVWAELQNAKGESRRVRASYVIGADGARGTLRDLLGIQMSGDGPMGNQIGIYFEADLWPWIADKPNLLWWIYNPSTVGVMIALDGRYRWTYNFGYDASKQQAEDYTPEICTEIVRAAVGVKDLNPVIQDVRVWQMQARVCEQLREKRVFLVGDAAHPLPPTGGQGMNTAVGDVHNLCWKLALVVRGLSSESLLDTYEQERMPIIRFNVEQSVRNARKMEAAGLGGIMKTAADFRETDLALMREAIPQQREHFEYHGQTYGYVYRSPLVFDEGGEPGVPEVNTYTPSAAPGHRAPHCWVQRSDGVTISTLDLFKDLQFTLLAGREGQAWKLPFRRALAKASLEGEAYCVGVPNDFMDHQGAFLDLYEIGPSGAVLIRPDGHVVWRAQEAVENPDEVLDGVLSTFTKNLEAAA